MPAAPCSTAPIRCPEGKPVAKTNAAADEPQFYADGSPMASNAIIPTVMVERDSGDVYVRVNMLGADAGIHTQWQWNAQETARVGLALLTAARLAYPNALSSLKTDLDAL